MIAARRRLRVFALAVVGCLVGFGAAAHEFWIDPLAYQVGENDPLQANIRVGQDFEGTAFPFLPPSTKRFEIVLDGTAQPVIGRPGDRPALNMAIGQNGLAVVVHVTRDYHLSYSEREKFVNFVTHKDAAWVLDQHAARGLPDTGFRERYIRFAKSLIAVGDGQGADTDVGLEIEIVAEANPYTDDLSQGLPVRVVYQNQPRALSQVELFAKAPDGTVSVTTHRTDDDGRTVLPVTAGYTYLADSVAIRPLEPKADKDPVWESVWASLTFAVPE